jgi:hypothetical protein
MTRGYHVTTAAKLERYQQTGAILPPVRFWPGLYTATRWAKRTGRTVILSFDWPDTAYPLPDHRPALWTPDFVREWREEAQ